MKRPTDVVGIVPAEAAVTRLVGAVPLEEHKGRRVGRRSFSAESLATLQPVGAAAPALLAAG